MASDFYFYLTTSLQPLVLFKKYLEINFSKYDKFETDIIENGQIQKFEYTIELLWKTLKKYFEVKRGNVILYPKDAIKLFLQRMPLMNKHILI